MVKKLMIVLLFMGLENSLIQAQNKEETIKKENDMVNIGISEKNRKEIAQRLNLLLSDEYTLAAKTQKFHWNVQGPFFGSLHILFGDQYKQLQMIIDGVAERSLQLGVKAYGSLEEFCKNTTLQEQPGYNPDDQGMIKDLLDDHETIIKQLREYIELAAELNDAGTNNFLATLIEKHEKMAWMLRAHLSK